MTRNICFDRSDLKFALPRDAKEFARTRAAELYQLEWAAGSIYVADEVVPWVYRAIPTR